MNRFFVFLLCWSIFSSTNAQTFVDLGLSVNWATVNLGASSPSQSGLLFAWGEIAPKEKYTMENYVYKDPDNEQWTIDIGASISGTEYDPARAQNHNWRMPTQKEFLELCEKCSWQWIDDNQSKGYKVIGPNGNQIFLPVGGQDLFGTADGKTGNYWSGSLSQGLGRTSIGLSFNKERYYTNGTYKYVGKLIRPVTENPNYISSMILPKEWSDTKYANLISLIESENYDDAFNAATMLAAMGDAQAQCVLATMYMCEVGTLRNYESAQELLAQAAAQGYKRGEYMLGGFGSLEKSHEFMKTLVGEDEELLYANDNNFWYQMLSTDTKPETFKDAFKWFYLEDGKWGYRDIMYYAGIVIIRGDYGYKNEENGLQWIIQSARLGYNDAIELLQVIDSNEE